AAVARRLAELAGLPAATAGGLTFPGGAYANIHALMVARNRRFPELVRGGMGGLRGAPVVFTSTHAHFSIEKAAVAAGIGLDHVERVPTDSNGRMDGVALRRQVERAVARGDLPFFVNATAGTTVLGAFDPVDAIADVCADHGLWLHVDGAWGGPLALFCKDVCNVSGLHRADSLSVSAHKLLGVPLQCSFLLVRAGLGVMRDALGLGAQYLFHGDEDDVGDATLGCGRRPDAIKLWLAWRYYGTRHFRARLMAARARARALAAAVAARPACATGVWRLVAAPQSTCVCFWFVPGARAGGPPQPWWGRATALLCRHVNAAGHVLIDYAAVDLPGGALPAFFRVPLNSPHVSSRTLEAVLDAIEAAAEALAGDLELLRRADGPPGDGPPREAPSPPSLP
ncbi:Glutamate decarboxylase 2, partial [Coemansia sp. RSA 2320]